MEAATIAQLKKALVKIDQSDLLDACLRLARFKKDNKELLTYLLFRSNDETGYANYLCGLIDEQFIETPKAHKKTLRKLIRSMDKWLRYSCNKETEYQVRLHFCHALKASDTPFLETRVTTNMYLRQIKKLDQVIEKFEKDIRNECLMEIHPLRLAGH